MERALSCLQDECDIKKDFAKGDRPPSSHISTGDTAQGFLQCCIQIPAHKVAMPQIQATKREPGVVHVRMNAHYTMSVYVYMCV